MVEGVVIKSTGSWYNVLLENGEIIPCRIKGKFRLGNLKVTNPVAVGDRVHIKIENEEDSVGTINKIAPRNNYVVRQSPRKKHFVHLIASNIDQAVVIVTMNEPMIKVGFIDRFLLMTEPYDIPVTLIFNKSDLHSEDDELYVQYLSNVYGNIGYTVLETSATDKIGIQEFQNLLKDKTTLISGQSGVGKSTLVNAVAPQLELRTQDISEYSGKGQHTTTFAEMFTLPFGGRIIDTPGIKILGFNHLEVMDVAHNFREFFLLSQDCKFGNCTHRNEPNCAVKTALENGEIAEIRYENYLDILNDIEDQNYWEIKKGV